MTKDMTQGSPLRLILAFAVPLMLGSLLVTAIQSNDYNVVIGLSFIYSAMYIGIMLVVDLLYGIIDPRIRLAKGDD